MLTLDRVQSIGRLGKHPESRFSLAVSNRWEASTGEPREAADCAAWRELPIRGQKRRTHLLELRL